MCIVRVRKCVSIRAFVRTCVRACMCLLWQEYERRNVQDAKRGRAGWIGWHMSYGTG